jgi:anthranilate synthase component 1
MEFAQLATDVVKIELGRSPLDIFRAIRHTYQGEKFLLESVEGTAKTARFSFIGFDPIVTFKSTGTEVEISGEEGTTRIEGDPVDELRKLLGTYRVGSVGITPFSGGLVGYLSYDFVRHFERLPAENPDPLGLPEAYLIMPRHIICVDHISGESLLISHGGEMDGPIEHQDASGSTGASVGKWKPWMDRSEYEEAVERAKRYIVDGDIFQTVLSLRYDASFQGDTLALYEILRRVNPSPYQYYLDYDDTRIIGSSPEMLVRLEKGRLVTRPLAGTRPRGGSVEDDERLRVEMLLDEKERAEHLMLVDLARNDLGRVSEYGSVVVDELMATEKYSHVQHIVSNVTSRLRSGRDAIDALGAVFPAGTVSGAPKVRAMEIIEELEPMRRGPYAGAVGYIDFRGNMDLAIAIRTMFTSPGRIHLQAGSGLVYDSDPGREYEECQNKLKALYASIGGYDG